MQRMLALSITLFAFSAYGQDKKALDSVDKALINTIISPAENAAGSSEPDWTAIQTKVRASYTDVQTDRAITKAKIFYYWNTDWPKFSTALIHYTEAYENKDDLELMNKNATMVLEHSEAQKDWQVALGWIQHAVDKAPGNADYKSTRDGLKAKLAGQ
jgi:hypothetical protein